MKFFTKNNLILFLVAVILSAPSLSNADISFQSQTLGGTDDIFNNLPAPVTDLMKNLQDISSSINNQVGKYINTAPIQSPINLNQISQMNVTEWLQGLLQNSFLSDIYSIAVKILQAIGSLAIWVLGIVIDLIKQILALIH